MRHLLVAATLLAIGALLIACLWSLDHPTVHALLVMAAACAAPIVAGMALLPVVDRQAEGRRR